MFEAHLAPSHTYFYVLDALEAFLLNRFYRLASHLRENLSTTISPAGKKNYHVRAKDSEGGHFPSNLLQLYLTMTPQVGMVGVGSMGSMMSLLFAEHGYQVFFFDIGNYYIEAHSIKR